MTFKAHPESWSYRIYLSCREINNDNHPYIQGKEAWAFVHTFACLSWLMWRETFSAGHQQKEALGASLSWTGAAEQKLRRSWGGRLFRGAILLAWLELCEICSGHYETFAFALQLKCGNCLSRSSAKPASSQLETTLSSSYLSDINYCSLLLASQQPAEKVRPFSKCCRNSSECHESIP